MLLGLDVSFMINICALFHEIGCDHGTFFSSFFLLSLLFIFVSIFHFFLYVLAMLSLFVAIKERTMIGSVVV